MTLYTQVDGVSRAMTAAEEAAYLAWAASIPAPPPIRTIRTLAFLDRLGSAKLGALRQAATVASLPTSMGGGNNPALAASLDLIVASASVNLDDPTLTAGITQWVSLGLLTSADQTALLANGTAEEAA
jgi:hypothetical protein